MDDEENAEWRGAAKITLESHAMRIGRIEKAVAGAVFYLALMTLKTLGISL